MPESRAPRPRRVDPVGQVLVILMLATLTSAIIEGPRLGWGSPWILALAVTAGVALAALVRYELRREDPLIELRFFRSAPFSAAAVIAVAAFAAFGGFLFLNTLYLQDVRGLSPLQRRPVHPAAGGHDRASSARSPAASSGRAACAARWSSAASGWAPAA